MGGGGVIYIYIYIYIYGQTLTSAYLNSFGGSINSFRSVGAKHNVCMTLTNACIFPMVLAYITSTSNANDRTVTANIPQICVRAPTANAPKSGAFAKRSGVFAERLF